MRYSINRLLLLTSAICLIVGIACKKDDFKDWDKPEAVFYGLTADNELGKYNSKSNGMPLSQVNITGLESGERIIAIDFRPATGQLYGLGNNSKLYTINPDNGTARPVGTAAFSPAINGTIAGFDFNPTVDRIRVVTNNGQNLRLHPETGMVAATDGNLNPAMPMVIGAAYTNNSAGSTTTELFVIDAATGTLFKQDPPNDGRLTQIGSLKVNISGAGGFDITPDNKIALASLTTKGKPYLFQINLSNGKATELSKLNKELIGLAIPTWPVGYTTDDNNNLLIFNFEKPMTPVSKTISGLQSGETVLGLDMRPATGQLYALGSSGRIYTINMSNGAAAAVGSPFATPLSGESFGFDFNPLVDRIRIVSNTGQNLRVHPETGVVAFVDGTLKPGTPMVNAAAYTNNFAGTTATVLYDVDVATDKLYKQDPPNDGTLTEVGNLGLNIEGHSGMDIGGRTNTAFGLFRVNGSFRMYKVNLTTGAASKITDFPGSGNTLAIGLGF